MVSAVGLRKAAMGCVRWWVGESGGVGMPLSLYRLKGRLIGVRGVFGELATEPKCEVRRRLRTLSWTRERREGCASSSMPASRALLSGRGECMVVSCSKLVCFEASVLQNNQSVCERRE